ncbi:unnamed protein product [Phytophthora lilii]|uniref:Unnamed protein product n=1 Tax=Phytophthora lilii TaxID=2077276 RepID=A0A9W6TW15_9STRA|nr:unnamed protein product [Phytophthora lilii]
MSRTNSDTQERAIDSAMVAQIRAKMEAINMQLNYRDWFWGGKTLEEVRALLHLPATGEAVGHVNWTAYLNYLKYIKEREVEAANAAMVEAIKWKLTYKGWFLDGKSFKQVRAILGIAEKGDDVDNVNWEIFQNYLKFVKEYAKQFT